MIFRRVIFVKFMAATCSSGKPQFVGKSGQIPEHVAQFKRGCEPCFQVVDGIIAAHGFLDDVGEFAGLIAQGIVL